MTLHRVEIEKIERYIMGDANNTEKEFVESLFLDGENNLLLRENLEKDWNYLITENSAKEIDLNHLLDRIHHTIQKRESLKRQKPIQRFMRIYSKVAAIFLLPVIIGGGFAYSYFSKKFQVVNEQEVSSMIYAPMGSRVSFQLPDGTNGLLNGGSKLSYKLPFAEKRNVRLEGEAWMEVKHDEAHPFLISAGSSTVKVVGTSLNVSTYPGENYIEVVLKEGKVEFIGKPGVEKVKMVPSERIVFQKGKVEKTIVDPSKFNGWIEGKLIFRSDPMAEVARRIERWYNVKILLADRNLDKYTFRATFQDDKLEDVLKFLAMTSPIQYKITPRKLHADGTYQKEIITIYQKK